LPRDVITLYAKDMSSIQEIRTAIERLPKRELARFRRWFLKYDAEAWDRQIEEDAAAGKLDAFKREALHEHRIGRTKEL
jgi:hypothetical protein